MSGIVRFPGLVQSTHDRQFLHSCGSLAAKRGYNQNNNYHYYEMGNGFGEENRREIPRKEEQSDLIIPRLSLELFPRTHFGVARVTVDMRGRLQASQPVSENHFTTSIPPAYHEGGVVSQVFCASGMVRVFSYHDKNSPRPAVSVASLLKYRDQKCSGGWGPRHRA